MKQNFSATLQYVELLTGSPDTTMDWRLIHDKRKDIPAHHYRGSISEIWDKLCSYNNDGYGVFCNINAMDGIGKEMSNVAHIRAHVIDLDDPLTASVSLQQALIHNPKPQFFVQSSVGKSHVYWVVEPYVGNEYYTIHQRKLAQLFNSDKSIIDAARVMRVPGFYHNKNEPIMVGIHAMGITAPIPIADLAMSLVTVNVIDTFTARFPLGESTLSAPSLEWAKFALNLLDPNDLDRSEWLSISAAFKQAGWLHSDDVTLVTHWLAWCARYLKDDAGENIKLWNSIRETEVGWGAFERRTTVGAYLQFGFKEPVQQPLPQSNMPMLTTTVSSSDIDSEILDVTDCQTWFKDCYFISRTGEIFSRAGRFMNSTKFNGRYGGKHFIITSTGKTTDEAWKAALRSTLWTIPKVDHVRFLPDKPTFGIVEDALGRPGINTYIPARIDHRQGDVTPWLEHVKKILPVEADRRILYEYLAHCVKFPGYKIPWSPMLQSAEGVGKTVFFEVMQYALGDMYVYSPKAPELVKSGSTFNAWMRGKLMIIVNEIKIDERRELIEILKPMITDNRVEIQSKGVDQEMEDNIANWLFFSNYKDAIPINKNGRRYAILFSALQSVNDILAAGMDQKYFTDLYHWLREGGGFQFIAHWLLNYPIERGMIPVRAPETSSHAEAIRISRSPIEAAIVSAVDDSAPGFRGGFISVVAVIKKCKTLDIKTPNARTVMNVLEHMGYNHLGRDGRAWLQEDVAAKSELFGISPGMDVSLYGSLQGYI